MDFSKEGYLVRYTNGTTAFVYSNPVDWPLSIINQVMCVHKMKKPTPKPHKDEVKPPTLGVVQ